jgi:hypothetical protein
MSLAIGLRISHFVVLPERASAERMIQLCVIFRAFINFSPSALSL